MRALSNIRERTWRDLRLIHCVSSNQRLCSFYRLGARSLLLSSGSSLRAGFATMGTLTFFLAPAHGSAHLGGCTRRAAPQDSYFICSSSQGAGDSLVLSPATGCPTVCLPGLRAPSFETVGGGHAVCREADSAMGLDCGKAHGDPLPT